MLPDYGAALARDTEDDGQPGGVLTNNRPPAVTSAALTIAVNTAGSSALTSSDPDGNPRTLRIVHQRSAAR